MVCRKRGRLGLDHVYLQGQHGHTCYDQRKKFLRLSYRWMGWWARRPKLYLPLWVDSWPRKWMNPFCTSQAGLTYGFKLRLQGRTPGYSMELKPQVPCGPGNQSGHRAWYWVWHSKYFAPKPHRVHLRKLTHSNPPLLLVLRHLAQHTDVQRSRVWTHWRGYERIGEYRRTKYYRLERKTETSAYKDRDSS